MRAQHGRPSPRPPSARASSQHHAAAQSRTRSLDEAADAADELARRVRLGEHARQIEQQTQVLILVFGFLTRRRRSRFSCSISEA